MLQHKPEETLDEYFQNLCRLNKDCIYKAISAKKIAEAIRYAFIRIHLLINIRR